MMVRAHIYIGGRVQGVSFRWAILLEARSRSVNGWVRNLDDRRVEAVFEGEKVRVEEMIDFCRKGPPGARVTRLQISWDEYKGDYKNFNIQS